MMVDNRLIVLGNRVEEVFLLKDASVTIKQTLHLVNSKTQ